MVVKVNAVPEGFDPMVDDCGALTEMWLHVGLQYLIPFIPTFQEVLPTVDLDEAAADERRVYVKGIGEFGNVYKFFGRLQGAATISARWYRIEEAERPTGEFLPSPLRICEFKKWGSQFRFWPRVEF